MSDIFAIVAVPFPSSSGIVTTASNHTCGAERGGGVTTTDSNKQQSAHCSLAAAPPLLNERRLSGKWAELRDLDLCERKEGRRQKQVWSSSFLSLPSLFLLLLRAYVCLLHSSSSFSPSPLNGCNDLSKKELLLRLAGWLAPWLAAAIQ